MVQSDILSYPVRQIYAKFLGVDILGVDILGVDISGVDILGVDIFGVSDILERTRTTHRENRCGDSSQLFVITSRYLQYIIIRLHLYDCQF